MPAPERRTAAADRRPAGSAQLHGTSRNSTSSTPRWEPWIFTRHDLAARSMPGRSLRTYSAMANTQYPASGHEVLAAGLEGLQPPVPVVVAFVVQTPSCGIRSLCPDLIDQPLRGSLRLQRPNRQRILRCCVDGLTVEHRRNAWLVSVVRNDQASGHNLSPWRIRTSILEAPRQAGFSGPSGPTEPRSEPLPSGTGEPTLREPERESLPSPFVDT